MVDRTVVLYTVDRMAGVYYTQYWRHMEPVTMLQLIWKELHELVLSLLSLNGPENRNISFAIRCIVRTMETGH